MDQRFNRHSRIRKSLDIQAIRLKGRKFSVKSFLIYRQPNSGTGPRIAIAITRKSGGSVVRNRVRRRLRELFRKNKSVFGNFDYFFFTSRDLTKLDSKGFTELSQAILTCVGKP